MDIIQQRENEYRNHPKYGVWFTIESDAYKLEGHEVLFTNPETDMCGGVMSNYQTVVIDGQEIGFLKESIRGGLFDPMTTSFFLYLPEDEITDETRSSEHFYEDESCYMRFATLRQMFDYWSCAPWRGTICKN